MLSFIELVLERDVDGEWMPYGDGLGLLPDGRVFELADLEDGLTGINGPTWVSLAEYLEKASEQDVILRVKS